MKIAVLTSSRADFGIYLPLLNTIQNDPSYELEIVAFGTHLSKYHGYTLDGIKEVGFSTIHTLSTILTDDSEGAISTAYGLTVLKFADFWDRHQFDCVLCLGDRFEMSAAVQAGIPFGVRFAHLHGGETTLGAIDNIYRDQITLASKLHFPATDQFAQRITELIGSGDNIFAVGSLSLSNLDQLALPNERDFRNQFEIHGPFALVTFHPETVSPERNEQYAIVVRNSLAELGTSMKIVVTMPNADTNGSVYRKQLVQLKNKHQESVILIENFGKVNYFAAMKYSSILIGNTSSGIIEAASFGKYVVDVGDRQKGRVHSENVFNVPFDSELIVQKAVSVLQKGDYTGNNCYYKADTVKQILQHLNNL